MVSSTAQFRATPRPPFEVFPYSFSRLLDALVDVDVGRTREWLDTYNNVAYLDEYLRSLDVRTVVIEHDYNDADYLADFSSYYVRCHSEYRRRTRRVHLFSVGFSESEFRNVLAEGPTDSLAIGNSDYQGFLVIKPLPKTLIGRTCLRTYPARDSTNPDRERHYPTSREYTVNLYGLAWTFPSVAFQEQDREVAACATSALWSLLHAAAPYFPHKTLSPYEITHLATDHMPDWLGAHPQTRRFPAAGLSATQAAYVMRHVGMEPLLLGTVPKVKRDHVEVSRKHLVNAPAHAYLRLGTPLYMAVSLEIMDEQGQPEASGAHAMTLLGYALADSRKAGDSGRAPMVSDRITTLYVHDDQAGPFARYVWTEDALLNQPKPGGKTKTIRAKPDCLIAPLDKKVRVSYIEVEAAITELDAGVRGHIKMLSGDARERFHEWEIRLLFANEVKRRMWCDPALGPEQREWILKADLPKHLWSVRYWIGDSSMPRCVDLEILIDATALLQEGGVLCTICPRTESVVLQAIELSELRASSVRSEICKAFLAYLGDE